MIRVTAATSFLGNEGMWRAGESKVISKHRAHELIEQGWVIESQDQSKLEAAEEVAEEPAPVTTESIRKPKKKPGEGRESKPEEPESETK